MTSEAKKLKQLVLAKRRTTPRGPFEPDVRERLIAYVAISLMTITCFAMTISRFGYRDQGDRSEATLGRWVVSSGVLVPLYALLEPRSFGNGARSPV